MAATTISLDPKVRDRLRRFGTAGMSYNEILQRIMDRLDSESFVAEMHRKADAETAWVELDDFDWS